MPIDQLYDQYYDTEKKKRWYEVGAAGKVENILRLCKPLKPATVLDIGAGNGALLQKMHDGGLGERLSAIEISRSGLEQLNARRASLPRLADVRTFDGVHFPYPDNSFDLAVLSHVIEHVEHPRLLLYEAARVARYLYAEVPLEIAAFKKTLRGDWVLDSTGHINYYTKDVFKRLLQTSGWQPEKIEVVPASKGTHTFYKGTRGTIEFGIKQAAIRVAPSLAQMFFVYHCATLSKRADRISISLGDVLPPYNERKPARTEGV
ncbi:MAG: class I SAM-dependent methyltransferase [Phycisphaerales bacterium]